MSVAEMFLPRMGKNDQAGGFICAMICAFLGLSRAVEKRLAVWDDNAFKA